MAKQWSWNMDETRKVRTQTEARQLVDHWVAGICAVDTTRDPAKVRRDVLSGIGYAAYYDDRETADRILDLFETEHPFFGRTHPDFHTALELGMALGRLAGTEEGRKRMHDYMDAGDYAGLRAWVESSEEVLDKAVADAAE